MRPVFAWFEPCSAKQGVALTKARDVSSLSPLRVSLLCRQAGVREGELWWSYIWK